MGDRDVELVAEPSCNEGDVEQIEGGPSRQQIEDFISEIREEVHSKAGGAGFIANEVVEVEDLISEETPAGVNPLPVDFPLLLINLSEIESDIDSVLDVTQEGLIPNHDNLENAVVTTNRKEM